MEFDITKVVEAIITLVVLAITTFLIPWIKSKTSKETQNEINMWVKIAVTAAEQIFIGSGRGTEKKEYVKQWLEEHKIKYDSSKIDAMIEAAVYELKLHGIIIPTDVLDGIQE